MKKQQHSPTPWRVDDDNDIFSGEDCIAMTLPPDDKNVSEESNAAFIVLAVNSFPLMLEALTWQAMADADPAAARQKGYYERARILREQAIIAATVRAP